MFKEITLAVILGGLLGVGLTGGLITLNNQNRLPNFKGITALLSPTPATPNTLVSDNLPTPASAAKMSPTPDIPPSTFSAIEISNYKLGQVVSTGTVTLKGLAPPNSQMIVVSPLSSTLSTSDKDGLFEIDIQLESGYNPLEITSVDPGDTVSQINFSLTYSSAKL